MGNKAEVLRTSRNQWLEAQKGESNIWTRLNQNNSFRKVLLKSFVSVKHSPQKGLIAYLMLNYLRYRDFCIGDDWNYWWMKQFKGYRALPKYLEKALEVGCGPYTNIRLISKRCKIREVHCADPLIDTYISYKLTWLSVQFGRNRIRISSDKCESIKSGDNYYDLVICINVLDHVEDAEQCLKEMARVIKPGGYIVLGQDLTNEEDWSNRVRSDRLHLIRIHHTTLDATFQTTFDSCLKKILPRDKGRAPRLHYGTYIFIGRKK